jgi:preprotein translocase subunit SecD
LERNTGDIRNLLRKEKIRYVTVGHDAKRLTVSFKDQAVRDQAQELIRKEIASLALESGVDGDNFLIYGTLPLTDQKAIKKFALDQNITTLRNRVNALGVTEPVIQQQGERRIVVELPGVQDPARLKELLGATATLEYRLVDTEHSVEDALAGRVPVGTKLYKERNGRPVLLSNRVIVTGDHETGALSATYALKDLSSTSSRNRFYTANAQLEMLTRIRMSLDKASEKAERSPIRPAASESGIVAQTAPAPPAAHSRFAGSEPAGLDYERWSGSLMVASALPSS